MGTPGTAPLCGGRAPWFQVAEITSVLGLLVQGQDSCELAQGRVQYIEMLERCVVSYPLYSYSLHLSSVCF